MPGFLAQLCGRGKIARDAVLPLFENAADARKRDARHDQIEKHERDREPDELGHEVGHH
ncbi:MAG: hypothetical protein HC850_02925 [Rhodomicrobium sp.]|nr:hypothetical protein [Rhodomicrobium sp.]